MKIINKIYQKYNYCCYFNNCTQGACLSLVKRRIKKVYPFTPDNICEVLMTPRRHTNLESKNEKNTFNRILLINVFECFKQYTKYTTRY